MQGPQSTTIHILPVELLLEVFTYIAHLAYHPPSGAASRVRQWAQLMLVCQRWRAVILSTPQFWTVIDLVDNSRWVELCLDRSRWASIDVRLVGLSPVSLRKALPLVVAAGCRIRSLTFQSYVKTISSDLLQQLFSGPMPALENLSVSLDWKEYYQPKVDLRLSVEKHPRLRYLALTGVILPIEPSVYSRIKSLALHLKSTPQDGLSFQHFVRILHKAALELREVELSHVRFPLPPAGGFSEPDHPQSSLIRFPQLWSFYMNNDHLTASRILGVLDIPVCTHFHIRVGITSLVNGSLRSTLLKLIPQNIRPLLDCATELAISMTANTFTVRDPGTRDRHVADVEEVHADRVYIALSGVVLEPQLDDIIHVAALLHLTALTISSEGRPVTGESAWGAVLSACPNLRTLDVSEHGSPTRLFAALTPTPAVATLIRCPALCALSVTLRGYVDNWGERVLACVQARVGKARRLSSLSLKWYTNTNIILCSRTMGELRSLVDELILLPS